MNPIAWCPLLDWGRWNCWKLLFIDDCCWLSSFLLFFSSMLVSFLGFGRIFCCNLGGLNLGFFDASAIKSGWTIWPDLFKLYIRSPANWASECVNSVYAVPIYYNYEQLPGITPCFPILPVLPTLCTCVSIFFALS